MDPQATLDAMHRTMIKREAALWFSSGRAIHAWRLRRIFRQAGWTVPEEIETYLDACGDRLCESDLTSPEQVAEAFAMGPKGPKGLVTSNELAAVEHFAALRKMRPDASNEDLFLEVGEAIDKSDSYVRDAYYKWFPQK
jgi:hypothetical protein